MPLFYINGKFLAQRTTGVQRVARCLVQALDATADQLPGRWVLLAPDGVHMPELHHIERRWIGPEWLGLPAPLALHVWEQAVLPWVARAGWLLCLAGSAPSFGLRQINLLHDAAVFDFERHYSPAFAFWYKGLFRRMAHNHYQRRLVTVSAFSRARLAHHLGVDPSRIAIVPGAGDHLDALPSEPGVLSALGLGDRRFLLAVGSDQPTKNFAALIAAYVHLGIATSCPLVLVGGRDRRVFADAMVAQDPPGVVRAGIRTDEELKALYEHALALVLPSRYEGFGLPAIEAMRRGCPVIASSSGALPEVCADAALFFDPASIGDIAAAIRCVLDEPALRERLRTAGLRRASAFTWAASAQRLLRALPPEALS